LKIIIKVNDKSLKENFEKIKREVDTLLKKMYFLNPNHTKAIPVLAIVFYDPNKSKYVKRCRICIERHEGLRRFLKK
jgi:type VI protein secretion system component VasA